MPTNKKQLKYAAGCLAMAACWIVGIHSLRAKPSVIPLNNAAPVPVSIVNLECETRAIEAELPLPTEAETIGIDFMLFEPLPAPQKPIRKSGGKKKVQNKSGQISGHKVR
jgi:hypothetical protein